ncbi:MAG TPA: hypothetical protein ENN20_02110 [Candidatus Marinimicrobia bacterium]|nr:hypothetical protein [Candidatus Neomarinimicrobiota bacterium]
MKYPLFFKSALSGSRRMWLITQIILLLGSQLMAQKRVTKEPRPDWVNKILPGVYVGVSHRFSSEADAREDALVDAKRQIIESLSGIIESEFIDQIIEQSGEVTTSDAFTSSRVKVVSRNILAVKPEKVFVEEWKIREGFKSRIEYQVFLAVPFSEEHHKQFMNELIDETITLGKMRFKETLELARKGQLGLALEQIKTVQANVLPMTRFTGLSPQEMSRLNEFKERLSATLERIPASIRIEGKGADQPAKMGLPLPEPLELSVYWIEDDQRFPIPDLEVEFKVRRGKAVLEPQTKTDRSGVAKCVVKNLASAGNVDIQATVYFPEELNVRNNAYTFALLPENRVIVKIIEKNLDRPVEISYLENSLLEKLTATGFKVLENNPLLPITENNINESPEKIARIIGNTGADLVILGTMSSGQTNKIQDGFWFARARGTLKVYNIQQKTVVGSYMLEDKNAGNSEETAGIRAIQKVSDKLIEQALTEMGL